MNSETNGKPEKHHRYSLNGIDDKLESMVSNIVDNDEDDATSFNDSSFQEPFDFQTVHEDKLRNATKRGTYNFPSPNFGGIYDYQAHYVNSRGDPNIQYDTNVPQSYYYNDSRMMRNAKKSNTTVVTQPDGINMFGNAPSNVHPHMNEFMGYQQEVMNNMNMNYQPPSNFNPYIYQAPFTFNHGYNLSPPDNRRSNKQFSGSSFGSMSGLTGSLKYQTTDTNSDYNSNPNLGNNYSLGNINMSKVGFYPYQQYPPFQTNLGNKFNPGQMSPEYIERMTGKQKSLKKSTEETALRIEIDELLENYLNHYEEITESNYLQMKGHFFRIIMSQNGSRILQKCLAKTNEQILSNIFQEVAPKINEMLIDQYANYFCPKLFILLNLEDRLLFLNMLKPKCIYIAKSKVGTYPLQIIIETVKTKEERLILVDSFKNNIVELCFDCQGVHAIEKIIACFEEIMIHYYYEVVVENFLILANNSYGLGVVKKVIIHSRNQEVINVIFKLLIVNALVLVQNPYGNYAIQMAIDIWGKNFALRVFEKFHGNLQALSKQKYSSNVLEKCFDVGGISLVEFYINEICRINLVTDLMKNNYGNYVVQSALKLSLGEFKERLACNMLTNIDKIKDKKLISKWKYIIEEHTGRPLRHERKADSDKLDKIRRDRFFLDSLKENDKSKPRTQSRKPKKSTFTEKNQIEPKAKSHFLIYDLEKLRLKDDEGSVSIDDDDAEMHKVNIIESFDNANDI